MKLPKKKKFAQQRNDLEHFDVWMFLSRIILVAGAILLLFAVTISFLSL